MNSQQGTSQAPEKPILRGHFHQAAFFIAMGACSLLIAQCSTGHAFGPVLVYALTLTGLFGISALYHRVQWLPKMRMWMRRLDHSAIFLLIAGTGTPILLLSLPDDSGIQPLRLIWIGAVLGITQSLFWVNSPKWVTAILYVTVGWLLLPYLPRMSDFLDVVNMSLLIGGGLLYTFGAVVYALKRPNPLPKIFGYHEIFHILVMIAATLHFLAVYRLIPLG